MKHLSGQLLDSGESRSSDDILDEIKSMHTEGLEADALAAIMAFTLASIQHSLAPDDLRKLILLSGAAYHLAKNAGMELQLDKDTGASQIIEKQYSTHTIH